MRLPSLNWDQVDPFHLIISPVVLLIAIQNVVEEQETDSIAKRGDSAADFDQVDPFHLNILPASSAAIQNVWDGQEIEST